MYQKLRTYFDEMDHRNRSLQRNDKAAPISHFPCAGGCINSIFLVQKNKEVGIACIFQANSNFFLAVLKRNT